MIKSIIKTLLVGVLFLGLLSLGGYTFSSFSREVHLKSPQDVLGPATQYLPDLPKGSEIIGTNTSNNGESTTAIDIGSDDDNNNPIDPTGENSEIENPGNQLPSNGSTENQYVDENGNLKKQDLKNVTNKETSNLSITYAKSIKINLDGKEWELTTANTVNFVKWLNNNYKEDSVVAVEVEQTEESTTATETGELVYNNVLANETDLNTIVKSIRVIDKLPEYDDYDRTTYEKPVVSYTLDGNKVNRNDYAWKTSKWFNAEDYTYMCPYTGTIITDMDDKKDDKDFGNLDYDHIVPLKSTYLRGGKDWDEAKRNEYAYDQWVGVDVLNSANRSKSDKGPCEYLPDINIEDYCYSWLMICSKYDLAMTQEEIDICVDNINIALENGEEVEFLGGSYEPTN